MFGGQHGHMKVLLGGETGMILNVTKTLTHTHTHTHSARRYQRGGGGAVTRFHPNCCKT